MNNIIIFGPPGSGKGTQSKYLVDRFNWVHLSTGDVFRHHITQKTELGIITKQFIDQGLLVPDDITINILEQEIKKHPQAKGLIFDGFPRTRDQAVYLDAFLASKNQMINLVLGMDLTEQTLIERLLSRGRSDDADQAVIKDRIKEYKIKTEPLKQFYTQKQLYVSINGEDTIEQIHQHIVRVIEEQILL